LRESTSCGSVNILFGCNLIYFVCQKKFHMFFSDHKCYIQLYENESETESENDDRPDKEEDVAKFIFFDFETLQERIFGENNYGQIYQHKPNLCVAYRVCDSCGLEDIDKSCFRCDPKKHIFKGENCLNEFCDFMFNDPKNINRTALAHNCKGFDGQFVLQYLQEQAVIPTVISKGKNSSYSNFMSILY